MKALAVTARDVDKGDNAEIAQTFVPGGRKLQSCYGNLTA